MTRQSQHNFLCSCQLLGHLPGSGWPAVVCSSVPMRRCSAWHARSVRLLVPQAIARQAAALLACLPVSVHRRDAGLLGMQPLLSVLGGLLTLASLQQHSADICQTARPHAPTPAHQAVCLTCACRWRQPVGTCGASWRLSAQLPTSVPSRPPLRRQSAWLTAWSMAALQVSRALCSLTHADHPQPEWHQLCSSPAGDTGG